MDSEIDMLPSESWKNQAQEVLKSLASLAVVFLIIYVLWYTLWKLAFEPILVVRDFFDLDSKPTSKAKQLGQSSSLREEQLKTKQF